MAMTVLVQHRTHTVSQGKGGGEKREVGKSITGSGKGEGGRRMGWKTSSTVCSHAVVS